MDYLKIIEKNKDEMIECLQELIAINSVGGEAVTMKDGTKYPFGEGVQQAFEFVLEKGRQFGFETQNIDNYGGHLEMGQGPEIIGILGHLDVVPEGDGWTFPPFSGAVVNNKIYGRGTTDDKGPMIACLYAMKALTEAGYEPARRVRLILGLDEETAWDGMYHYLSKVKAPDFGITPDADFPAINGEKGFMTFEIARKFARNTMKGLELRSIEGGSAPNMVAASARAVVRFTENAGGKKSAKSGSRKTASLSSDGDGLNFAELSPYDVIRQKADTFRAETGYKLKVKTVGKSLEITTEGISAHGAHPHLGLNAVSILFAFLGELNFVNEDVNDFIEFYNKHLGFEIDGESFGCAMSDEPSGALTLNVGLAKADTKTASVTINIRYPVTRSADDIYGLIEPVTTKYNLGIIKQKHQAPIYMAPDSPMIRTLMEVYQKHTGDTVSQPLVIGGGTYARATPGIVAFGAAFPGDEDRMHQKDECLDLDKFLLMTKIYADTIVKLCELDFQEI